MPKVKRAGSFNVVLNMPTKNRANVDTGGGAYIGGRVQVNGTFVGRDMNG